METMAKKILRIKEVVSGLGLSQEESLTFMAGMLTQHLLGSDGLLSNEATVPDPIPTTELPECQINSRPSELSAEQNADVEDPHVAHALGISHKAINFIADKLGVADESETKTVEQLGIVRTPFVVVNGWKVTATERREGRATKYSLIAERGDESQKEPNINALPHAVNWVKKHCQ